MQIEPLYIVLISNRFNRIQLSYKSRNDGSNQLVFCSLGCCDLSRLCLDL